VAISGFNLGTLYKLIMPLKHKSLLYARLEDRSGYLWLCVLLEHKQVLQRGSLQHPTKSSDAKSSAFKKVH